MVTMTLTMTMAEALARFDALPAVTTQEMHGHWRGSGVPTGHDLSLIHI